MKVLVTGGSGFVGAALIKKLLAENHEVSVILNQSSAVPTADFLIKNCRGYNTDIRNSELIDNPDITTPSFIPQVWRISSASATRRISGT